MTVIDDDPRRLQMVHTALGELGAAILAPDDDNVAIMLCAADAQLPVGAVPVLIYGAALPSPDDAQAFRDALAPWLDRGAAFGRLAQLFGDAAIIPMARRLADDLTTFLATNGQDPSHTHRLGGFAGTLGFRRLAYCLEQLSVGDRSFDVAARREAVQPRATLCAYLEKRSDPTTLV